MHPHGRWWLVGVMAGLVLLALLVTLHLWHEGQMLEEDSRELEREMRRLHRERTELENQFRKAQPKKDTVNPGDKP